MNFFELLNISPGVTAVIGSGGKTSLLRRLAAEAPGTVLLCTTTHIRPFAEYPLLTDAAAETVLPALLSAMGILSSQRTWTGRTLSPQTWVKIKPACWQSGIPLCLEWRQSMFQTSLKSCRI